MSRSAKQVPNLSQYRLILASASPRRVDLTPTNTNNTRSIIPAYIDETPRRNELPADYALRMAIEKAGRIAEKQGQYAGRFGVLIAPDRGDHTPASAVAAGRAFYLKLSSQEA